MRKEIFYLSEDKGSCKKFKFFSNFLVQNRAKGTEFSFSVPEGYCALKRRSEIIFLFLPREAKRLYTTLNNGFKFLQRMSLVGVEDYFDLCLAFRRLLLVFNYPPSATVTIMVAITLIPKHYCRMDGSGIRYLVRTFFGYESFQVSTLSKAHIGFPFGWYRLYSSSSHLLRLCSSTRRM